MEQHRINRVNPGGEAPIPLEDDGPAPVRARPVATPMQGAGPAARPKARASNEPKCPNCGYLLGGLIRTDRCPECGTKVGNMVAIARRAELDRGIRKEYLVAAGWVSGCWAAMCGVLAAGGLAADIPVYLLVAGVTAVVGFVVFVICSVLWIGFDQPLGVSALRLAAIYAITDLVLVGLAMIPVVGQIGILRWLAAMFVYYTLMTRWLDMEGRDVFIVSFLSTLARAVVFITIAMMF